MTTTISIIPSKNNYDLSFTVFEPDDQELKNITILISPAMAVLQRYYKSFAEYLCNKGYNVLTFDHIGTGESKFDVKDSSIQYKDWATCDIELLVEWIEKNLQTPIYYIAHSAGGQLLGITPSAKKFEKIFIISSGIGYWKFWSFPRKYYYYLAWHLFLPAILKIYGYSPSFVMNEKVPIGIIRQWLFWTKKKHFVLDDPATKTYFNDIKADILYIAFTDDAWAPFNSAKVLASFYKESKMDFRYIHPKELGLKKIGHFGFFRKKVAERAWDILNL